jgi:hypothetical protein
VNLHVCQLYHNFGLTLIRNMHKKGGEFLTLPLSFSIGNWFNF